MVPDVLPEEEVPVVQVGLGDPELTQETSSEQEFVLPLGQQMVAPPPRHLIQVPLKHFGTALFVQ